MRYAKHKPTIDLSVSRMDGSQSMMKSVLDDLRPEPWPKIWQKFDIEGAAHKEFVPPGQMVSFIWVWNLVADIEGGTQAEGIWE